jgi:hypothetical protein
MDIQFTTQIVKEGRLRTANMPRERYFKLLNR